MAEVSSGLLAVAYQVRVTHYLIIAIYPIVVLDWLLLFDDERKYIHQARWNLIKVLYFLCRYYPLLYWPISIWGFTFDHLPETCSRIVPPLLIFLIPLQMAPQGVILLRTYAFTGRNRIVLFVVGVAYLGVLALQIWTFAINVEENLSLYEAFGHSSCWGGGNSIGVPVTTRQLLAAMSTSFMDFLSTAIVLLHCYRIRSTQGPLGRTFLREGLIVFIFILTLNMAATINCLVQNAQKRTGHPFSSLLSNVLVCRLILNLRRMVNQTESYELKEQSRIVREALLDVDDTANVERVTSEV